MNGMKSGTEAPGGGNRRAPTATLLVPCFNEAGSIGPALRSVLDDFVRAEAEILVIDGGSSDDTRAEVEAMIRAGEPVRILDNPGRIQSRGLNLGIGEARGRFIVRLDAHGLYPPHYVKRCLELLEEHDAACAGGVMWPQGETPVQKAVAAAMRHPLGVGNARYHLGGYSGEYEGVYLGAFRREVFETAGLFDPRAVTNEDAELYARIRKSGGRIWLDGSLRVTYHPRKTFRALAAQYFRYGRGRFATARKHRGLTSWRQVAPLIHLMLTVAALGAALWLPWTLLYPGAYFGAVFFVSLFGRFESVPAGGRILVFLSFIIMHFFWAAGFLSAPFSFKKGPPPNRP
jgi:succinoglycan biosynthesis protein ExoA